MGQASKFHETEEGRTVGVLGRSGFNPKAAGVQQRMPDRVVMGRGVSHLRSTPQHATIRTRELTVWGVKYWTTEHVGFVRVVPKRDGKFDMVPVVPMTEVRAAVWMIVAFHVFARPVNAVRNTYAWLVHRWTK